jgi:hypothetical protein
MRSRTPPRSCSSCGMSKPLHCHPLAGEAHSLTQIFSRSHLLLPVTHTRLAKQEMILPRIASYAPGPQRFKKFSHHHTGLTTPINATAPDPRRAPTHTIAHHNAHSIYYAPSSTLAHAADNTHTAHAHAPCAPRSPLLTQAPPPPPPPQLSTHIAHRLRVTLPLHLETQLQHIHRRLHLLPTQRQVQPRPPPWHLTRLLLQALPHR